MFRFLCAIVLVTVTLPAAAQMPVADPWYAELPTKSLRFQIQRNGSDIGYTNVDFTKEGDRLIVETETWMRVRVLFITAFRFKQTTREVWENGRLIAFEAETDDDGYPFPVRSEMTDDGLRIIGVEDDYIAPEGIVPTTYWNPATLTQTAMLNTRKGNLIEVDIKELGTQDDPAKAAPLGARHVLVDGPSTDFNVYYCGSAPTWCGFDFETRGSAISYVPLFDTQALLAESEKQ